MTTALCENLRFLLFKENIKAADLSKLTKVPQATIHRMLSGESKNPHKASLLPIADFFSVTVEQLLEASTGVLSKLPSSNTENHVPVFLLKSLALNERKPHTTTEFSCENREEQSRIFATIIEDDSMSPLFPPGSTIILDPNRPIENGSYAVIKTTDQKILFRQIIASGGDFYLKPLSPDIAKYGIMRLEEGDQHYGTLLQAKLNF